MPVVFVRALRPSDPDRVDALLASVPAALEQAAGVPRARTWVSFTALDAQAIGPRGVHDPAEGVAFVELLLRDRGPERVARAMEAVAEATAAALGLPLTEVWLTTRFVASGGLFAGGAVQRWTEAVE
ncbi:MAG: hypothetical protein H6739_23980 [Alphaproteobacteria bacterium]|nr:hypothetical protein [Alphaproteobacteria bacterium]